MLKSLLTILISAVSFLAVAEEQPVVILEMPQKTDTCNVQILKSLNITNEGDMDLSISANIPTDEYTDYLVNYVGPEGFIVATMRCFKDGRPMNRIN